MSEWTVTTWPTEARDAISALQRGLRCAQCGQPFLNSACGPTHALIAADPTQHIAVAALLAGREAAAWDEGYEAGADDEYYEKPNRPNPYARAAAVAGRTS